MCRLASGEVYFVQRHALQRAIVRPATARLTLCNTAKPHTASNELSVVYTSGSGEHAPASRCIWALPPFVAPVAHALFALPMLSLRAITQNMP